MKKQENSSFGKKFRSAEKEITKGLIKWVLKRKGLPPSDEATLDKGSEKVVDEAHRIIKSHSKNVLEELKRAKEEFLKASRDEDKKRD